MPSAALFLMTLLAAAAQPADPRVAARQILERGRYQTDLPSASPRPGTRPPPVESTEARPSGRRDEGPSRSRRASGPAIPLPPATLVWAVFAGLIVVGLVWAVRQSLKARRGAEADPLPPPEPERPPAPRQRLRIGPLTDVEELARQGRFGEAIHLLLLHLFAALQRRPTTAPAPAHTGREVLARTKLAADARAALGVLVKAAESVHFGGRVAAREDYENCLGHYRRFLDVFERAS